MPRIYVGDADAAYKASDGIEDELSQASIRFWCIGREQVFFDDVGGVGRIDIDRIYTAESGFDTAAPFDFYIRQITRRYVHTPLLRRHSGDE